MTTARNAFSRAAYPNYPLAFDVTTDQTVNQGDMVWWDATNGTLKPLTAQSQVAFVAGSGGFCGVANGGNLVSVPVFPPPGGTTALEALSGVSVQRLGSVWLFCTAGESYYNYIPVTVGATAQTVTMQQSSGGPILPDSTHRVGWVVTPVPLMPQGAAGSTPLLETITGTGQLVEVLLESKFPATTVV